MIYPTQEELELIAGATPHEQTTANTLKVGDIAIYSHFLGIVGEIKNNCVYLWHNNGNIGGMNKDPYIETDKKYKRSWMLLNEKVEVIRKANIKPPSKDDYLKLIKSNLLI